MRQTVLLRFKRTNLYLLMNFGIILPVQNYGSDTPED
jgi:hypothetical protein